MKKLFFILLACTGWTRADTVQITSPIPLPVSLVGILITSGSIPPGSPYYIQNTLSPSTTTQMFSVMLGTFTSSLTLPFLTPGQCTTTNATGLVINTPCGGGGASSLGVNFNGVSVTSPTAQINFTGPGVYVTQNGSTATVTISSWPAGSGGGGSGSPLEVLAGVRITSPTLAISFNSSQFSGTATGSTATISLNGTIAASTTTLGSRLDSVATSTGSIATSTTTLGGRLDNVALSTGAIATSTTTLGTRLDNVAISTGAIATSTTTLGTRLDNVAISTGNIATSTTTLGTRLDNVAISTGAIATSTTTLGARLDSVAISTGNIATSTTTLGTRLDNVAISTGNIATSTTTLGTRLDNVAISTTAIAATTGTFVTLAGIQTITGNKTFTSSVTISAPGGLGVTYGATVGTMTVYSTVVSSEALVVKSTNSVSVFSVANGSVTAGDFMLSISSANPGVTLLGIDTYGHLISSGVAPAASSCGVTPVLSGTDFAFTVAPGATATGCTITFANAFPSDPTCTVNQQTMSLVNSLTYTHSATNVVIAQTGAATNIYDVICVGKRGP